MSGASNLKMHINLLLRPFREEARSLVTLALKHGRNRTGIRHLLAEGSDSVIRLDVYPVVAQDINECAALVVFSEVQIDREKESNRPTADSEGDWKTTASGYWKMRLRPQPA